MCLFGFYIRFDRVCLFEHGAPPNFLEIIGARSTTAEIKVPMGTTDHHKCLEILLGPSSLRENTAHLDARQARKLA